MADSADSYQYLMKFLIIGDAGTGKTSILHRFSENKFLDDASHTIGVEFGSKIINLGSRSIKLQIWDTAGQERFRSVTRSYYRGSSGALLVYDISSRGSYNSVARWLQDARALASPDIVIILCGNKRDLEAERDVTFLEASAFAQENGLMFLETSAMSGENVDESFLKCARTIVTKIEDGTVNPDQLGSGVQRGDQAVVENPNPRLRKNNGDNKPDDKGCC